uniref:Laccase4 n=1 Tax=Agaricus brasiliensis TaxID=307931 RepID=V5XWB7_9AGAR|nr:laccase4 [Agaricus brasiliensis]
MYFTLHFTSLLLWVAATFAETIGPTGSITLSSKDISPDGFKRSASVINGGHPGPVITANKEDNIKINVVNQLTDPDQILGASIHWHGMFQRGTNFMDGVTGVTQCPIAPNNSFEYSFSTGGQAGTYWYHSHFDVQYCDGVRGALIVYDTADDLMKSMYDVDDESTIISLSDWYHQPSTEIVGAARPDSTLINGKGRYVGGPAVDLAVVKVTPGKRYRFRLVSMSCAPNYVFSIDGHNLTIIETEGVATSPLVVDSIRILAGQRYSFVLHADQTADNYWIRALPSSGNNGLEEGFDGGINSAILRYEGAAEKEPKSPQQNSTMPLLETNLHPAHPETVPDADERLFFTLQIDNTAPSRSRWRFNDTAFAEPEVPVLLQILSGVTDPAELLPKGSIYRLEKNRTYQLDIQNGLVGGPHPFHLHGHEFWVIRSADNDHDNINPIKRDTVSGGTLDNGGVFSIRFTTDNPGPWILHCHIDFHLRDGLAIVLAEAPEAVKDANPNPPDAWKELCEIWDNQPDTVKNGGHSNAS